MKNSQKNNNGAKKYVNAAGKKAQVRNKRAQKMGYHAPASKPKMEKAQKIFIALTALICVFAISFVTLGSILLVDIFGGVKYGSVYDEIKLSDYIKILDKNEIYKGQDVDLSGIYRAPYTIDDMDGYLEDLRYENRKLLGKSQMTKVIGYGDDFSHFVVSVLKDGKYILEDDWAGTNYVNSAVMTLGSEAYGADFDAKLAALGVKPMDTALNVRYNGTVSLEDVIALSYSAYKVSGDAKENIADSSFVTQESAALSGGRMDLAALTAKGGKDAEFAASIVENCKAVEQPFEFYLSNYDLDGNGTISNGEKAVKFVATVDFAVVEEKTVDVNFTLPNDYFSKDDFATSISAEDLAFYLSLNGAELTFRLIITVSDDYELPELNASFIKETLKFKTDKTSDAEVIEAFKQYSLVELNKALEESLFNSYVSELFNQFGQKAQEKSSYMTEYPTGTYEDAYYEAYDAMVANYYAAYGTMPATQDALDQFAYSYVAQNYGMQVSGIAQYCQLQADSQVKQELLMYHIFRTEKLVITEEMMEEAYREYVDSLITSYGNSETYNEEYFIEQAGGKDVLYATARRKILVYRVVGEYLLENNNITYTK